VRQLVQHGLGAALVAGAADLRPEDVVLEEGDGPGVLHRARVELRHEELVVLVERVRVVEDPVEVVEALLGDLEELVGVQELRQRRTAVEAQRDALVRVGDLRVGAGDQRDEVGGDALGRLEVGELRARGPGLDGAPAGVGDDLPVEGGDHVQREGGLEVGLVEAGEHPLRVGRLELGVEVDLLVLRVGEAVQALAGVGVAAVGGDHQRVLLREAGQRQAAVLGVGADVELGAVQRGRVDGLGHQVDEGVRSGLACGELHRRRRAERVLTGVPGAVGHVELDVVGLHVEQLGARGGIGASQVGNGHGASFPCRDDRFGEEPLDNGCTREQSGRDPA
jgi:hypothetical protein